MNIDINMQDHIKQPAILINYTGRRGGGPLAAYEMKRLRKEAILL